MVINSGMVRPGEDGVTHYMPPLYSFRKIPSNGRLDRTTEYVIENAITIWSVPEGINTVVKDVL